MILPEIFRPEVLDLSERTKQQILDTVVEGLARQEWRKARDSDGLCVYLSPNGDRCAAGQLAVGFKQIECLTGSSWLTAVQNGLATDDNVWFIANLQNAHDKAFNPSVMRANFRQLVRFYSLRMPKALHV
jgi:hypothetical protein